MFSHIWAYLGHFFENQSLNWKANGHIGGQTNNFLKFSMLFFRFFFLGGGLLFLIFLFLCFCPVHFWCFLSSSKNLSYVSMLQTNKQTKKTRKPPPQKKKKKKQRKKLRKKKNKEKNRKGSQTEKKKKKKNRIKLKTHNKRTRKT